MKMRNKRYLTLLASIWSIRLATASPQNSQTPPVSGQNECDCYIVSGPEPGYFQNYRFYDFRSIDLESYPKPPPISATNGTCFENELAMQRRELGNMDFLDDWKVQDWSRDSTVDFPVTVVNSRENVFVSPNTTAGEVRSTFLTLRATRLEDYASTAEIETLQKNIFRCSLRVRLRLFPGRCSSGEDDDDEYEEYAACRAPLLQNQTTPFDFPDVSACSMRGHPPPSGAVAGVFTYHSAVTESDIEILTSDPTHIVRYANQPDYDYELDREVPGASTAAEIPVPWTQWATHRLDWFPDTSRWFLDNELILYKEYGVPDKPSMLVLNLWTNGGIWSGNLSVGSSVFMGVEYVEIAYNTSDDSELPTGRGQHHRHGTERLEHRLNKRLRRDWYDDDEDWEWDGDEDHDNDNGDGDDDDGPKCHRPCHIDAVDTLGVPKAVRRRRRPRPVRPTTDGVEADEET